MARVATRTPLEIEEWGEAPEKLEEAEPDLVDIELEEGIDDPVRMYLREIGKVSLLTADDEKRLARSMEDSDYIQQIENAHFERYGRHARPADAVTGILNDLHSIQKPIDIVTKEIGVHNLPLPELIVDPQFRKVVDGEIDLEMAAKLAAAMKIEQPDAERRTSSRLRWSPARLTSSAALRRSCPRRPRTCRTACSHTKTSSGRTSSALKKRASRRRSV